MANPKPIITHDGDCYWYNAKVCTCGLLHTLMPMKNATDLFPEYEKQLDAHLAGLDSLHHQSRNT